jgi:glycosyltransferase involved in cell wall biosynthesis/GT2 family glycosyltransferase
MSVTTDVVHLRPSNFVGGPERQILRYAGHEQDGLYRVAIASFCDGHEGKALLDAADARRIETLSLSGGALRDLMGLQELTGYLRERQVKLLCTHGYRADLIGLLAARRCGIPVVWFLRGWTGENAKICVYETLDRGLLKRADRIVCLSQLQADRVAALGVAREKIRIVPNAVEPPRATREQARGELSRRFGVAEDDLLVGIAGRLSPEKGAHDLIRAVQHLAPLPPRVRFLLFGDGPLRASLEQEIAASGLGAQVMLAGFHGDFPQLLPGLDLLVNPSHREEMPNVVLEAMAAGVPVLATAVGGVAEIAGPAQAVRLIPAGQPEQMAVALQPLLGDAGQRQALGAAGKRRIAEAYSLEHQRACLRRLYEEMTGGPARTATSGSPAAETEVLPMVSVVIPVRNEAEHLPAVLDQLLAQDYPADRMEILVADGMSDDATPEVIRRYEQQSAGRVRGFANPARRSSAGRNVGLRHSCGDWVLFVDGHCHIPSATMLRDMVLETQRQGAECIARPQPLTAPGASRLQRCIAAVRATRIAHGADSTIYIEPEGAWVHPGSSGAGYSRKVLNAVGAYDESFDACEDVEFNCRVQAAGYQAWLSRKFTVEYQARATLHGLWRQMMRYGRGRVRLARKHPQEASLAQWAPAGWLAGVLAGGVLAAVVPVLREPYLAALALYFAVVLGYSLRIALRQGAASLGTAPLAFLAVHAGLGAGTWQELLWGQRWAGVPAVGAAVEAAPESRSIQS